MLRWFRSTVRNLGGHSNILSGIRRIHNSIADTLCSAKAADKPSCRGTHVNRPKQRPRAGVSRSRTGLPIVTKSPIPILKGLTLPDRPLTDDRSVHSTALGMGGRMKPARDRTTFRSAMITDDSKFPPVDILVQGPGSPVPSKGSYETLPARSSEASRDPSPDSLETLSSFLLPQNLASPTPQKLSTNTLRSLYKSVKARAQLPRLSSDQMTALLSLFGSLSLAPPRPTCIYINKFVSHMEATSFRTFWPFVLGIARDKAKLGKPLNGIDRYWIMRAQLANVEASGKTPRNCRDSAALIISILFIEIQPTDNASMHAISQATEQYLRIYRHTADPDVHLPFLQVMLSLRAPKYVSIVVHRLCTVLRVHDNPHYRLLQFFWGMILKHGNDLPLNLKEKLLLTLWNRLYELGNADFKRLIFNHDLVPSTPIANAVSTRSQTDLGVHQMGATLGATIFPYLTVQVPAPIRRWAVSLAVATFDPSNSVEERWNNLLLLAIYNTPPPLTRGGAPQVADNHLGTGNVTWRTVFVLATLEKTLQSMGPLSCAPALDIKCLVRILWRAWKNEVVDDDHRPPLVACAVVTAFFRLSLMTIDASLKDGCRRYCLANNFWLDGDITKSTDLIAQYVLTSVSRGGEPWPEIFSTLNETLRKTPRQAEIIEAVIWHILPRDTNAAHELYLFTKHHDIRLSADIIHSIGVALAKIKPINDAIPFLNNPRLSRDRVEILLDSILRPLRQDRRQYLDPTSAAVLGKVMKRLYAKAPPSKSLKYSIRYIMTVLAASGNSSEATALVEFIHRKAPSFFNMPFFLRFMRVLVRHHQLSRATRLLRLLGKFPPPSVDHFRRQLILGLARCGASALARRVYKPIPGHNLRHSTLQSLIRVVDFQLHSPPRYLAIRILRIVTRSISDGPAIRCALSILIHARHTITARKLFERSYKDLDPTTRTCLGNIILHGSLRRPSPRNGRLVRHILRTKDLLMKKYGFVPDRVTVNITLKAILRWQNVVDPPKLRALFDHMIRGGYLATGEWRRDGLPFATPLSSQKFQLPPLPPFISFEKHVRPMCKMFIKGFHLRGDVQAAKTVVGILKAEESAALLLRETRNRARLHGLLKVKKIERLRERSR